MISHEHLDAWVKCMKTDVGLLRGIPKVVTWMEMHADRFEQLATEMERMRYALKRAREGLVDHSGWLEDEPLIQEIDAALKEKGFYA